MEDGAGEDTPLTRGLPGAAFVLSTRRASVVLHGMEVTRHVQTTTEGKRR
jgi:hypothetical protein